MRGARLPNSYRICFVFFQAEDGIRDYKVTGVQTCAHPIWSRWSSNFEIGGRSPMRSGRLSQDLSNLHRQFNWTERLMQERYAPVKDATLSNYIRRVTRHKRHLQVRVPFLEPLRQLLAVHSRHYNICQQQVKLSRNLLGCGYRFVSITRFNDVI